MLLLLVHYHIARLVWPEEEIDRVSWWRGMKWDRVRLRFCWESIMIFPSRCILKVNQGVGITLKKRGPQSLLYLYLCSCCATIRFLAFGNLLIKISITSLLDWVALDSIFFELQQNITSQMKFCWSKLSEVTLTTFVLDIISNHSSLCSIAHNPQQLPKLVGLVGLNWTNLIVRTHCPHHRKYHP